MTEPDLSDSVICHLSFQSWMPTYIRLATPADAAQVREIYAPFCEDSPVSFEVMPPSVAEIAGRIRALTQTYPWLVCERANKILGYAYACQHRERAAYRWAVDISVYVAPDRRGRGIGKGLLSALSALLRTQGFFRAYGGVALPNPASVGLLESSGFHPVGVYDKVVSNPGPGTMSACGYWSLETRYPSPRNRCGSPSSIRARLGKMRSGRARER
jgi:L-amino acid N-acyltransferase YncA